ncbi:MAG: DNA alkylation repair protein [Lentimicrobium sp.]|nr:DNA alkylation repair protein [Lentimicrobium sp.]
MKNPESTYVKSLRDYFEAHANPAMAPMMEKYMKNHFRFLGIKSPERKAILRNFISEKGYPETEQTEAVICNLWKFPEREFQYLGMELASKKAFLKNPERNELIEWMIIHKSWWDTVDFIAGNLAGVWFQHHPEKIPAITEKWMSSGNLWLQRSCLLFQLKYRSATNTDLLTGFILQLKDEKDFFIRKAIGWALRELSKTSPKEVEMILKSIPLSNLSRTEALKYIQINSEK